LPADDNYLLQANHNLMDVTVMALVTTTLREVTIYCLCYEINKSETY